MIIDQIVQEAQNYEGMFTDIFKLNPDPRLRQQIKLDITWARKTLRKNDRIVWFLRWVKVWLISTATGSGVAAAARRRAARHARSALHFREPCSNKTAASEPRLDRMISWGRRH